MSNRKALQTHFDLSVDRIIRILYDYNGPGGAQRKYVLTADWVYVYDQRNGRWIITHNWRR